MRFDGKTIVISGGGRGLGRTLAILLARAGANVHLSSRDLSAARQTVQAIHEDSQRPAWAYTCNISDRSDVRRWVEAVSRHTDHVDIVINNAAFWLAADFQTATDSEVAETIETTALGTIWVTKHFMPLVLRSTCPDILTIVSRSALSSDRHDLAHEAYHAAKSAQAAFAERLKARYAKSGLRVISVFPPDFDNIDPLGNNGSASVQPGAGRRMTSRSVAESVLFALGMDRLCTVEKIILDNTF